ncbi:DJ-1/PfpI family protein [Mesorhizobium sp. M0408]
MARRAVPISAVGTATWLLARTGLLAGARCTIRWSRLAAFAEVFNQPRISDSLFVKDGQYSTCAGELAAFELAVDLIGSHAGGYIAQEVCRHATVQGQRSGSNRQTGPSGLAFAGVSDKLLMAMRIMEENVEFPLTMEEVAHGLEYRGASWNARSLPISDFRQCVTSPDSHRPCEAPDRRHTNAHH